MNKDKSLEEKLQAVKDNPFGITEEIISSFNDPFREARDKFTQAVKVYRDDISNRKANMKNQSAEMQMQEQKLSYQKNQINLQIADAVSRCDLDTAASLETQVESIDSQVKSLQRKISLADPEKIKGDKDLYGKLCAAFENLVEAEDMQLYYSQQVFEICDDVFSRFRQLRGCCRSLHIEEQRREFLKIQDDFNGGPEKRAAANVAYEEQRMKERNTVKPQVVPLNLLEKSKKEDRTQPKKEEPIVTTAQVQVYVPER